MNNKEVTDVDELAMQEIAEGGLQQKYNQITADDVGRNEIRKRQPRDKNIEYMSKYLNKIDFSSRQLLYVSK
ncbi:MAG: hypothetical protein R3Y50_10905 [Rikenellaceae bacterium]